MKKTFCAVLAVCLCVMMLLAGCHKPVESEPHPVDPGTTQPQRSDEESVKTIAEIFVQALCMSDLYAMQNESAVPFADQLPAIFPNYKEGEPFEVDGNTYVSAAELLDVWAQEMSDDLYRMYDFVLETKNLQFYAADQLTAALGDDAEAAWGKLPILKTITRIATVEIHVTAKAYEGESVDGTIKLVLVKLGDGADDWKVYSPSFAGLLLGQTIIQ